ncbi:hypothetical protein B0H14DRAFT_2919280 [Mycena olivaceomarginata]|nr:hypothetical protein B0H14DRAFT_2919280 [Mycena olivaceomarginata]
MLATTPFQRQLPSPAPRAPYPEETSGPEALTDDHRPNEHTLRGVSTGDPMLKVVILYRLLREDTIMVFLLPVVTPFHCPLTSHSRPTCTYNLSQPSRKHHSSAWMPATRLDPGTIWTQETCVICSSTLSAVTTSMCVLPSLCATIARKGDTAADVNYGVPLREVYDAWCDQGYSHTTESVTSQSSTTAKPTIPMLSTVCIGGVNTRRQWSYNRFTLCTMTLTTMTGSDIHHADRLQ